MFLVRTGLFSSALNLQPQITKESGACTVKEPVSHLLLACFTLLYFTLLCFALLCFALLCFALLCFALLCFALLCFALLCFALLCFALLCLLACLLFGSVEHRRLFSSDPNTASVVVRSWLVVAAEVRNCLYKPHVFWVVLIRCRFFVAVFCFGRWPQNYPSQWRGACCPHPFL